MAGMRDPLIHEYFGVDYEILGDVATGKAPELIEKIERFIQKETASRSVLNGIVWHI